jgi:predicted phage-related endonuclease
VIERDEAIIESLIELESNFWNNHVLANVPPAFGAHDTTLLAERYQEARDNESFDLTPFRDDVLGLIEARNTLVDAKHTFEDYKNKIKGHMEFAELGFYNGELMFTWKNTKKSRTFRIIGADE